MWANYISSSYKFPLVYMCRNYENWLAVDKVITYCRNKQAYFFGPPCTAYISALLLAFVSNWPELSTMPCGVVFHASGCMLHSCWLFRRNRFISPHSRQVIIVCERFLPTQHTHKILQVTSLQQYF